MAQVHMGATIPTAAATVDTLTEHVAQELHQLVLTGLCERLFLSELGTNIKRLVFENIDETTAGV